MVRMVLFNLEVVLRHDMHEDVFGCVVQKPTFEHNVRSKRAISFEFLVNIDVRFRRAEHPIALKHLVEKKAMNQKDSLVQKCASDDIPIVGEWQKATGGIYGQKV